MMTDTLFQVFVCFRYRDPKYSIFNILSLSRIFCFPIEVPGQVDVQPQGEKVTKLHQAEGGEAAA